MEEEIKNLLNCGYYDECNDYIVELNEEKMKDFFHVFFKADKVIFMNKDTEKIKAENQKLKEKFEYMMDCHKNECKTMENKLHCMQTEYDKKESRIIDETNKKISEIKDDVRMFMKLSTKYL